LIASQKEPVQPLAETLPPQLETLRGGTAVNFTF
jgi:hypothetical protein